VTLPNGLVALLASDPDTDKAGAALSVSVGYYQDPDELPGLAHFCEHMLFLGTAKYPVRRRHRRSADIADPSRMHPRQDENEYMNMLAQHGGRSNAFTQDEMVCYILTHARTHARTHAMRASVG